MVKRLGMFICLHVNNPSRGGAEVLLLETLSCEAISNVNSLRPQGHTSVCNMDAYSQTLSPAGKGKFSPSTICTRALLFPNVHRGPSSIADQRKPALKVRKCDFLWSLMQLQKSQIVLAALWCVCLESFLTTNRGQADWSCFSKLRGWIKKSSLLQVIVTTAHSGLCCGPVCALAAQ